MFVPFKTVNSGDKIKIFGLVTSKYSINSDSANQTSGAKAESITVKSITCKQKLTFYPIPVERLSHYPANNFLS